MSLTLAHIDKRYGERAVLDDVSLALVPGRIHALVGENGAGKSTLLRIACGLVTQDRGSLTVDHVLKSAWSAQQATALGVGVVHQHFTLVDTMTVAENVVLGREPRRGPWGLWVDRDQARARVIALGKKYKMPLDPDAQVQSLSVGERQRVELMRVLDTGAKCVLLDEPTAVLSPGEIQGLLQIIAELARAGASVLLISHKLDEVFALAQDITVLRRGKVVLAGPLDTVTRDDVAHAVVGGSVKTLTRTAASEQHADKPAALEVKSLEGEGLCAIDLRVARGEIVGIAGVEGNGQRVLFEALAGLRPKVRGRVSLDARAIEDQAPHARRSAGLGFVPEDREITGLFASLSISENLCLGDPGVTHRERQLSRSAMQTHAEQVIARYDVRPALPDALVGTLSGGNAQKILVARELERPLTALLIAQPTRGVDIGAAAAIRQHILDARAKGVGVLLVSSELDELRALCDRVVVMHSGAIVTEMPVEQATDERLGPWMLGAAGGSHVAEASVQP
ncbi:MAG: ABC transporter ATP-binding protein [Deltaproteobacteria bacterium]|nr:ABC transporter ATP-binding protein [Deltaproteobacteria bacterium]